MQRDQEGTIDFEGPPAASVAQIRAGGLDFASNGIICVYAYHPPLYAVYRTETRVMVHFADDGSPAGTAAKQRACLASLMPLRGQINSLIDGWHTPPHRWFRNKRPHPLRKRAMRYDRRVADALVVALEGDGALAAALLSEVKNDIISERIAMARTDYLLVSLVLMLILTLILTPLLGVLSLRGTDQARVIEYPQFMPIWTAVLGGSLGAFFSIAIGLKSRTVLIDLQNHQNMADAFLRMLIGAVAGGMLLCLLVSDLLTNFLQADKLKYGQDYNAFLVFVIGFLAGFFERLVPDLLSQTNLGTREQSGGTAAGNTPPAGRPLAPQPDDSRESQAASPEQPNRGGGGTG
jgi:hypothetical protein